jgi:hypothetical protein
MLNPIDVVMAYLPKLGEQELHQLRIEVSSILERDFGANFNPIPEPRRMEVKDDDEDDLFDEEKPATPVPTSPGGSILPVAGSPAAGLMAAGKSPLFWMKRVDKVDWTKPLNGYALEGKWVNKASVGLLRKGDLVVVCDKSSGSPVYRVAAADPAEKIEVCGRDIDGLVYLTSDVTATEFKIGGDTVAVTTAKALEPALSAMKDDHPMLNVFYALKRNGL